MQNYPVFEVVVGVYPPTGATIYVVQQGTPTIPNPGTNPVNFQWIPAASDPNNLAVKNNPSYQYGYAYTVGVSAGNYATAAAAQAAANLWCQTCASNRDNAAQQQQFTSGDATKALAGASVELGPI